MNNRTSKDKNVSNGNQPFYGPCDVSWNEYSADYPEEFDRCGNYIGDDEEKVHQRMIELGFLKEDEEEEEEEELLEEDWTPSDPKEVVEIRMEKNKEIFVCDGEVIQMVFHLPRRD